MTDQIHSLEASKAEQHQQRISRRALLRGALTIGLALPVSGGLLAACSTPSPATAPAAVAAATQAVPTVAAAAAKVAPTVAAAATQVAPTVAALATQVAPVVAAAATQVSPVVSSGAKLQVSILGKEMTKDEVVAALKTEQEVNIANWTFTANDAIVGRFQDVVKADWGVDVKCNYLPSQSPSVYLTILYTANKGGKGV